MVSLVISIYKNLSALELILKSLREQSCSRFEVIIAEDNDDNATKTFIEGQRAISDFEIKHVYHEDTGFRKTKINNDAIKIASHDKLVFIDGDCILHPRFIETYDNCIAEKKYFYGRRVMLGPRITEKLYKSMDLKLLDTWNILLSDATERQECLYIPFRRSKKNDAREIWGCNWGVLKEYLVGVNGFDEDYVKPCFGEDLDVGWRLRAKYGLELVSLKNRAIQYHLHHPMNWDTQIESEGRIIFNQKKEAGHAECINGLRKS